MGEFRQRMEQDMQIRDFSPHTQYCYLARVKEFVRYFMRPPNELGLEEIGGDRRAPHCFGSNGGLSSRLGVGVRSLRGVELSYYLQRRGNHRSGFCGLGR